MNTTPEDMFDMALKQARAAVELKPILDNIRANPHEAADLIFQQMAMIDALEKQNKQLKDQLAEYGWKLNPERMGK